MHAMNKKRNNLRIEHFSRNWTASQITFFRGFDMHTHFRLFGGIKTMNRLRIFVTIICII